jgi:hypothetical protein
VKELEQAANSTPEQECGAFFSLAVPIMRRLLIAHARPLRKRVVQIPQRCAKDLAAAGRRQTQRAVWTSRERESVEDGGSSRADFTFHSTGRNRECLGARVRYVSAAQSPRAERRADAAQRSCVCPRLCMGMD